MYGYFPEVKNLMNDHYRFIKLLKGLQKLQFQVQRNF